MKTIIRPVWLVVLLVGIAGMARSEHKVLDSLIRVALDRNPGLIAIEHRYQASRDEANGAGALPDPMLSIGFLNLPRSSLALDKTPMSGVVVGLSQTVPWPGKLRGRTRLADIESSRRGEKLSLARFHLAAELARSYYDYAFQVLSFTVIAENKRLAETVAAIAGERYANGEIPAREMLRSAMHAERLGVRLLGAEQNIESARLKLERILGNPIDDDLAAILPQDIPIQIPADEDPVPDNPVLREAGLAVRSAGAAHDLARSDYRPDITVGIDYRLRETVPGDPTAGEDYLSFKVGFNIPLWFFARQKKKTAATRQLVNAARQQEIDIRNRLTERLADTRQTIRSLQASLAGYTEKIVPRARAAAEAARIAYEVNEADFDDFLSARNEFLETELERLTFLKKLNKVMADYDELVGRIHNR